MDQELPLFPEAASTIANQIDALYLFLVLVSAFMSLLISVLIVVFGTRYRRARKGAMATHIEGSLLLEVAWTIIPFGIVMFIFAWGAKLFFDTARPPAGAREITVTGKQWMWKLQHAEGPREINELHVPIGQPIKLIDDLGGRDPQLLRARVPDQAGRAAGPLQHRLVRGHADGLLPPVLRGVLRHRALADDRHRARDGAVGLRGLAGGARRWGRPPRRPAPSCSPPCAATPATRASGTRAGRGWRACSAATLRSMGGRVVTADETYVRRSILEPAADIVAGYDRTTAVMPTYDRVR